MRLVWQLGAVTVVALVGGQTLMTVQDSSPWLTFAVGVVTAVLSVLVYGWVVRRTERRTVTEVARKGAAAGLGTGTLIGVAVFGAVIANIAFLGYYEVGGRGSVTGAVGFIGFMAGAAVTEELLFRGVLFRIIEERAGTWVSMALTGLLFGMYHLLNPDATVWGALAIALEAGGMLTAAYVATRTLWVPIGLHFGWNFAAAGIFSTVVSGNGSNQGLLDATLSGPAPVTGGRFGPEGSLYSVLFCVLVALAFLWHAGRRGRLVPPRRGRTARAAAGAGPGTGADSGADSGAGSGTGSGAASGAGSVTGAATTLPQ